MIDRDTNQANLRRKHAKYVDTRSGRLRLAVIADNRPINSSVRQGQREAGTTLLTDGHASYPGLATIATIPAWSAPWPVTSSFRGAIALLAAQAMALAHITASAASTSTPISTNRFRYNRRFYRQRRRNPARPRLQPCTNYILGHHQPRKSKKTEREGFAAQPTKSNRPPLCIEIAVNLRPICGVHPIFNQSRVSGRSDFQRRVGADLCHVRTRAHRATPSLLIGRRLRCTPQR